MNFLFSQNHDSSPETVKCNGILKEMLYVLQHLISDKQKVQNLKLLKVKPQHVHDRILLLTIQNKWKAWTGKNKHCFDFYLRTYCEEPQTKKIKFSAHSARNIETKCKTSSRMIIKSNSHRNKKGGINHSRTSRASACSSVKM